MTRPIEAPTHFNAQQVAALEKDIRAKLDSVVKDVELRKWAAEHALNFSSNADEAVTLAGQVYRFIAEPLDAPMVTPPPVQSS